ncbi:uncharacterized protein LOC124447793 isoform X2 [Xenia sp. Carnegie-2017]|uniref:uncharacterized protein LOC124447793 isoform X2 n=1 Tax=Xenia sp. Carnegie-2017 TaxID=2897299 RepID=UPI001F0410AF|nr:uncharacterized protein LOC124447793 isoform X2 [Xenia sp. Carnegie-2017]
MTARKVTLERFVVKFRFSKTRPDEMDLDEGDVVLVAAKFNDGWYKGIRLRGYKVGCFPEDVVEKDTAESESCNGLDLNDEIGKSNLLDMSLTDISTTSDMTETSKELNEELKRTRAAQEILSTEISYCNGLDSLVKNFIHPMKLYGVLSVEEIDIIFSNIESLAGISKEMVAKLEKRMSEWNVETTIIGDIFVEMFSYLKMFKPYFDSRSAANQLRIRYEKTNEKFKNFLSKANCAHSLDSLLLMPIQRVPRYELLLKELVKRTSKDHPDFEYLSEALAKAQETATDLNEHIRQIENEAKIFDIIKMFPNDELDLIISNNSNDNNNSPKLKTSIKSKSTLEIPNMGRSRTVSLTDLGKLASGNSLHHAPSDPALHHLNHKHRDSSTHIFKTRMFIHEGPVQKVVLRNVNLSQTAELPQEYSERYLILFSDVVFVAVSSGNVLTGNKFKLKERSHLSKCWIMSAEKLLHRQVPPEAFVLGTPKRTYIFIAPAIKEKKTWEKLLHERIAVEKARFLELWRARPVPNEIFLKTIVKSKVEYRAMNVNELDLCVNEEVSVIGFRKMVYGYLGSMIPKVRLQTALTIGCRG